MLTLNDGRSELWQWDTSRKLAVDADCSQVHFSNKVFGRSIDVDVVDGVAVIPDILLQTDKDLNVWAFVGTAENGYTKISKTFKVNRRNKPSDYVFTPPDQTSLEEIKERLEYIEQNPVEVPVQSVNGQTGEVKLTAGDVGAISQDDLQEATNKALAQAKASGEFDGADGKDGVDGKDGYTPVKGVDYFDGQDGKDGNPGADGKDGTSPVVSVSAIEGGHRITITDTNGTKTVDVLNGTDGKPGKDGADGAPGEKGEKGDTGAPGADGAKGDKGDKGDTGATGAQGEPGKDGADGKDGTSATHSWNGTVLTITSASGTSSADLKGAKGDKGDTGEQGIQGIPGEKGEKGDTGAPGASVQSDWNQTDETAADFIKNKPFGDVDVVFLDEEALAFEGGYASVDMTSFAPIGSMVTVVLDGTTYTWQVVAVGQDSGFGNLALLGGGEDTGEPLCGVFSADFGGLMMISADAEASSHAVKITGKDVVKLPTNYYNSTVCFYASEDGYLCLDVMRTTKATRSDVEQVVGKIPITVMYGLTFMQAIAVDCSNTNEFVTVTCYRNGNFGNYHTAEYTRT